MITKQLYDQWYAELFTEKDMFKPDEKPDGEDFHSLYDRVYFADVLMRLATDDWMSGSTLDENQKDYMEKSRRILDSVIAEFTAPGFTEGTDDQELVLKAYILMGRNLLDFPRDGQLATDFFEFAYKIIDRNPDQPELRKYDSHVYFFRYLTLIEMGQVLEVIAHVQRTLNNQLLLEGDPLEISLSNMLLAECLLKSVRLGMIDDELADQLAWNYVSEAYLYLEKSGKYPKVIINTDFYGMEIVPFRLRAGLYESLFPWDEV